MRTEIRKNIKYNYHSITWYFAFLVDSYGSIQVAELDWGNEDQIKAVDPPFDYIIGTDVVSLLEPILFQKGQVTSATKTNGQLFWLQFL